MKLFWNQITPADVIKAIKLFEESTDTFPAAKSTFLCYNGKYYPAKHIRALSYLVAFGQEAAKSDFSGGLETVRFFEYLGFTIHYAPASKTNNMHTNPISISSNDENTPLFEATKTAVVKPTPTKNSSIKVTGKNVVEQKNALQLVLNRYFNGDIVSEKTFPWMTTPADRGEFSYLFDALEQYRGKSDFDKPSYKLRCDFVCDSQKVIFEYDERQHFTLARKAALDSYPEDVSLHFDKTLWVDACENIKAQDNAPLNRDETRAYYDSIRDLRSAQHGYRLIRIMHGAYDWSNTKAIEHLEELLYSNNYAPKSNETQPSNTQNSNMTTHTIAIARETVIKKSSDTISIVTATLQRDSFRDPTNKFRSKVIKRVVTENPNADIILLPAGFFDYFTFSPSELGKMVDSVANILKESSSSAVICLGVDCDYGKDQLAFAIDQSGVLATGRKFFPTSDEKGLIHTADQFDCKELGNSRIFEKRGKKFYLAVCYDVFGIRRNSIPNPGVDGVLAMAHRFHLRGEGPSGDVDFARKGFAGASMQWSCPVFGTAVFFDRKIPEKWPTGVMWNAIGQSVKSFKYSDNQLQPHSNHMLSLDEECVLCHQYHI